jgi:predicted nucleic acid-binding Zn ribbon protein
MGEPYTRNPNTRCLICSKPVYRRPAEIERSRVFCSSECFGIACRKEALCIVCGASILARKNRKTCSRACSNTYRTGIRYKIGRPKDNVKDQRAAKLHVFASRGEKCERCGYNKKEVLNVHHKDRNRKNNDLNNLELLCPNCHAEEHYLKNSWLSGTL